MKPYKLHPAAHRQGPIWILTVSDRDGNRIEWVMPYHIINERQVRDWFKDYCRENRIPVERVKFPDDIKLSKDQLNYIAMSA